MGLDRDVDLLRRDRFPQRGDQSEIAGEPPGDEHLPRAPADVRRRRYRPAIDWWIPLMMFAVEMPRETMLMTSVSASTAQIDEQASGFSAWSDSGPISSIVMPR